MRTLEIFEHTANVPIVHHVCCLTGMRGDLDELFIESGAKIIYLNLHEKLFIFRFVSLILKEKYDVIHSHVHNPSGVFVGIGALLRVKGRIVHYRSTGKYYNKSALAKLRDSFLKKLINLCSTDIVAVSKSTMLHAWSLSWEQQSRCRVIYNGIPIFKLDKYKENKTIREELGINHDAKIVCQVGRFDEPKNHVKSLRVFQKYMQLQNNTYLILCGLGGTKEEHAVREFVNLNEMDGNVFFLGVRKDVRAILANVDVVIFPSKWEGLPGVVLEAASVGTPVLASDIPVISEITSELGCVYKFPLAESDENWSIELHKILEVNSSNFKRISNVDEYMSSCFSFDKNCEELVKLWLSYK